MIQKVCPPVEKLLDKRWRLENLYKITNKDGKEIDFKLNWAQIDLADNFWYQMLILKARQLGVTSFFVVSFLDDCFWLSNIAAGIIADKKESSEEIFKRKVKFAYDRMPEWTRQFNSATNDRVGELAFENGSSFRVSTGFRSGTYQRLLISEFGKICAKSPEVATEIITGSLNTVSKDQIVVIESTAEGSGGHFYDMCQKAQEFDKKKLERTPLDQKFFFYPWWREPSYTLAQHIDPPKELKEYFFKLESHNINLSGAQIAWYCKKYQMLGDNIYQEYPSTPDEAFRGSATGLFYGKQLAEARIEKRISSVPYDRSSLVHTAWDLGFGDYTAIWFFQLCGNEIHLIDFYQDSGKPLPDYIHYVKQKPYTYGHHIAPHDIRQHEFSHGLSRWQIAYNLGFEFTLTHNIPMGEKALSVIEGIDAVRNIFPRCWFDEKKCSEGLRMLENYRKEWDNKLDRWSDKPIHDISSDAADSFRYMAIGLSKISKDHSKQEDDMKALKSYWG